MQNKLWGMLCSHAGPFPSELEVWFELLCMYGMGCFGELAKPYAYNLFHPLRSLSTDTRSISPPFVLFILYLVYNTSFALFQPEHGLFHLLRSILILMA